MLLLSMVAAWVIMRAWEQARAQAGAEVRRARNEITRAIERRLDAGRKAGPGSSLWWWAGAGVQVAVSGRRIWRGMKGPRPGATRPRPLPSRGPLRRILAAAWEGGKRGGREGWERTRQRRQAGRARQAGGGRARRGVAMAACDDCGQVCAATALALAPRQVAGRSEYWLLCPACREAAPDPAAAPGHPSAGSRPGTGQGTAGRRGDVADAEVVPPRPLGSAGARALQSATAAAVAAAVAASSSPGPAGSVRPSEPQPSGQDPEGASVPGDVADAEIVPGDVVDAEIVPGDVVDAEIVPPPAVAAAGTPALPPAAAQATPGGPSPAGPARGRAIAALPPAASRSTVAGGPAGIAGSAITKNGESMPTANLPAVTGAGGESYTHGQWNHAVADIHQRLGELPQALDVMLNALHSADAGRSQVTGVVALAEHTQAWIQQVRHMLAEVNRRQMPVVEAVTAAGGPGEIASIPYLNEV